MNFTGVNPCWLDWVPGYLFFKRPPTEIELASYAIRQSEQALLAAHLNMVKVKAELDKQRTIHEFLTTVRVKP